MPGWSKVMVHVPVPLVMVTVPPLIEHAPDAPMVTGRPDEAVAATENVVLKTAVAGAAWVTVMVWLSWLAGCAAVVCVTCDAAA